MVLEVSGGAVGVVLAETNGGGPPGHLVSSASVSRFGGSQKSIFFAPKAHLQPSAKDGLGVLDFEVSA